MHVCLCWDIASSVAGIGSTSHAAREANEYWELGGARPTLVIHNIQFRVKYEGKKTLSLTRTRGVISFQGCIYVNTSSFTFRATSTGVPDFWRSARVRPLSARHILPANHQPVRCIYTLLFPGVASSPARESVCGIGS